MYRPGPYANINQNEARQNNSPINPPLPGFLKPETVQMLWSPIVPTNSSDKKKAYKTDQSDKMHYGMGWTILPQSKRHEFCKDQRCFISHTGGAMGASSVLLILPRISNPEPLNGLKDYDKGANNLKIPPRVPEGVVVTIICNTSNVSLTKVALDIAKIFESLRPTGEGPYRVQKVYQC